MWKLHIHIFIWSFSHYFIYWFISLYTSVYLIWLRVADRTISSTGSTPHRTLGRTTTYMHSVIQEHVTMSFNVMTDWIRTVRYVKGIYLAVYVCKSCICHIWKSILCADSLSFYFVLNHVVLLTYWTFSCPKLLVNIPTVRVIWTLCSQSATVTTLVMSLALGTGSQSATYCQVPSFSYIRTM